VYFYAQRWSERSDTWVTEGDQYEDTDSAAFQLGRMRAERRTEPEDNFRITVYLSQLTLENEYQRLAK